jgi:hypothetical protein
VRELVAEPIDARDVDLEELHAPEVPDQIAELPLEVGDRVVVETVALLRVYDLPSE